MKKTTPKQLAARKALNKLEAIDARCRALYEERDQVEAGLIDMLRRTGAGTMLLFPNKEIALKDNFLDRDGQPRNVAFKTAAVKRFEVVTRTVA